ncbi:hypothetical protein GNI_144830, partial [Gregarina niphandrodes]
KAAVEKAAVEKAAVEKAAVEKAAVEKAAVEKAAGETARRLERSTRSPQPPIWPVSFADRTYLELVDDPVWKHAGGPIWQPFAGNRM